MLHLHQHTHCEHDLKFCEKCDVVFCKKCSQEWKTQPIEWYYPTYPAYYHTAGTLTVSNTGNDVEVHSHS